MKIFKQLNKSVFTNFLSLSILQLINIVLPFLTFPYLVRVLGVEKYGLIFFAQSFISYFLIFAEYGFNLSGVREIAKYKSNKLRISIAFNSIFQARIILCFIGFIVMLFILLIVNSFIKEWKLYLLTYSIVFGTILFPTWLFQGLEKMKLITLLSAISKIISTCLIFVFVKKSNDYLYVPLINSIGSFSIGIISLIIIAKGFGIHFYFVKGRSILRQLRNSWHIFISGVSINLYTVTTTFILGLITNNTTVGYYVISEKILRTITFLFTPFYQAIYPYTVSLANKSKDNCVKFLQGIFHLTLLISILLWILSISFSNYIFTFFFNQDVSISIFLFKILSPLIIFLPMAMFFFNVVFLSFNLDKYYSKIYITCAIFNLFLLTLFIAILGWSTIGAVLSLLITEVIVTIYGGYLLCKNEIDIFSGILIFFRNSRKRFIGNLEYFKN